MLMQRERGKKRDSGKKSKGSGGRQNRSEGGAELSGLSWAARVRKRGGKRKRQRGSSAANRRKQKVKNRSLGSKIDFLRFLPHTPLTFEFNKSRGFLRASGSSMLKI